MTFVDLHSASQVSPVLMNQSHVDITGELRWEGVWSVWVILKPFAHSAQGIFRKKMNGSRRRLIRLPPPYHENEGFFSHTYVIVLLYYIFFKNRFVLINMREI